MCGIVGRVIHPDDASRSKIRSPESVLKTLQHRGPDSKGHYNDGNVWLGHVRLSVLDLSAAAGQPMSSSDGRYVISYNGEVYNFTDLARSFNLTDMRSHSDTEVVLRAFEKKGIESIRQLNGMFAFAVYDKKKRKLWLVRDRLGIKPLYYRVTPKGLYFASEIKGILALDDSDMFCDLSTVHEWTYYGVPFGERTLYAGIKKLLPGHYIEFDLETFRTRMECYWSPVQYAGCEKYSSSIDEQIRQARNLLEQGVRRQLVSDVPVGVFLSGGVDSSAITAFASRNYDGKLSTYSVGFDFEKGENELPKAKRLARLYGTDHNELHISGYDIADLVEKMVQCHDMPFSDAANIPLYLLSKNLNSDTKVILQGDGGDELFGGYRRYSTLSYYETARIAARFGKLLNYLMPRKPPYYRRLRYCNALTADGPAEVMALLLTQEDVHANPAAVFSPEYRQRIIQTDPFIRFRECQKYFKMEDHVNQMLLIDAMIILPEIFLEKVDRSTMAASIEVRVPFLDNDLVDFCMRLTGPQKMPYGKPKWLLKKALRGIVPSDVLYGKKAGFGVPYGYWLRGALRPLFFDHMRTFEEKNPKVLDGTVIRRMYEEHTSNRRDHSFMLWKILNFMVWANHTDIGLVH